uniref:hypothetical protein n=1 Tax=Clostridioides difficile TaxID=1496 RepID=UPI0031B618E0
MNLEKNGNDDIEDIFEKQKRLIIPFLMILFLYGINCFLNEANERRDLAIKEGYTLDYKLEQAISNSIEVNNSVNLANVVNIDFNKVCIYYSFSMLEKNKEGLLSYTLPIEQHTKEFNEEIPKINFRYIVLLDKDGDVVKSFVLNKKYDILGNRSYMEYSKKDSLFKFKKVKGVNEYSYELN